MKLYKPALKICLILAILSFPLKINADSRLMNVYDAKLLNSQFTSFTRPTKLIITPLKYTYDASSKFSHSIFFYFVEKLGFPQSPIQYSIDRNGNFSKLVNIDDDFITDVVVAVDVDFNFSQTQIDSLFEIVNRYEIAKENILIKNVKLSLDKKSLQYVDSNLQKWNFVVDELGNRPKTKKQIKIDSVEAQYPKTVDHKKLIDVNVRFKNVSGFTIYKDDGNKIYVRTQDDKESELYVNGQWLTKSKAGEIQEQRIKNGDNGTIKFQILTPIPKGSFGESFEITNNAGEKLSDSFKIDLIIKDNNQRGVQIVENGLGFVNVRENPSYSGNILGTVNKGEKYVVIDKQGSFLKINIPLKNIDGWIPSANTRDL